MITKSAFFALLNDANNKIGVTAHIAAVENANGTQSLIIRQNGAPNAGLSNHKAHTTTIAAFTKYNAWLNEWFELQAAHAEALTMNTTHDNKVIDMNKARAKQQQTAANLPKPQMVDVIRAFLRTTPASQEQIDGVAKLSESELARLIRKFDEKGARITAHLTKSKSAGYGFLTFGYNGQLPPGTYHKMIVTNMKNAREVASRYGAMMWNF